MTARRWIAGGGVGTAVAAVVAVVAVTSGGGDTAAADSSSGVTPATARIERRDLVETEDVDGTLGYADARTVTNRVDGTLTWLPTAGSVVRANHRLYEVDGAGVYLLDGTTPAWRALAPGTSGRDVRQLERNLRHLGLDPDHDMRLDGSWDPGTTAAVERWQRRKGLTASGRIELGRVVFQPGTRRVAAGQATLGGSAGQGGAAAGGATAQAEGAGAAAGATGASGAAADAVLSTTSVEQEVSVQLKTSKAQLARTGSEVGVELPSGAEATARITSVGSVATAAMGDDATASDATVEVTLELSKGTRGLDQAPVTVRLEQSRRKDVLAVPVTALQAKSGGGFAVEVREGATSRVVTVDVGLSASGWVEVSGAGLREGMSVSNAAV